MAYQRLLISLSSLAKPVILDSDTSDNTFVGDELFVQCQVGGIPDPAVTWSKDGADLVDNSPSLRIITVGTNQDISRVEVDSAQQANAGMYTCTATNAAGSASMVFMVDVNGENGCTCIVWYFIDLSFLPCWFAASGAGVQMVKVSHLVFLLR